MNPIVNTRRDSTQSGVDGALIESSRNQPHLVSAFSRKPSLACGAQHIKRLYRNVSGHHPWTNRVGFCRRLNHCSKMQYFQSAGTAPMYFHRVAIETGCS